GCSAHFDELETRYAFRTRLLDCIWAGLPVVTTTGDALAEVVRERGLGRVVGYEDVDGYARALEEVLERDRSSFATGVAEARRQFTWPEVVGAVAEVIGSTAIRARKPRAPDLLSIARYGLLRGRVALAVRGVAGIGTRTAAARARRARGDFAAH